MIIGVDVFAKIAEIVFAELKAAAATVEAIVAIVFALVAVAKPLATDESSLSELDNKFLGLYNDVLNILPKEIIYENYYEKLELLSEAKVVKRFTVVIYCHSMVIPSFCVMSLYYLSNNCRMAIYY